MLPLVLVFTIVLLAFWPGIMSPDAMVQWHQVQTGVIDNWHPAYVTLFMSFLARIWNSPTLIIIVQYLIMSIIFAYTLTRLEKYYRIKRKYLLLVAILFALFPLNFNFAVNMLKDTLYAFWLLLLGAFTLDIINDKDWLKKWYHVLLFIITGLLVCLYRHNGILVMLLYALIFIIIFHKKKIVYLIGAFWICSYLVLTTVGFKVLNIQENNYANKYGPVTHIFAKMLNDDIKFSSKELATLNKFADVDSLKETYNLYNMDYSIGTQKMDYLKNHGKEYLIFALQTFKKHPMEVVSYYLHTTSYFYSPIPFKNSIVAGLFNQTELYIYEDTYPNLQESSKIPWLNNILKKITTLCQLSICNIVLMRPFMYILTSLIALIYLVKKYKQKLLFLIIAPSLLNILSLAPAMPVASVRYIYITILTFFIVVPWALFKFLEDLKVKH